MIRSSLSLALGLFISFLSATSSLSFGLDDVVRLFFPQTEIRYRLTLVYEKGGMEYSGSGVIAAIYETGALPQQPSLRWRWRGETLGVDIPGVGRVFALAVRPRQKTPSIISDACNLGSSYDLGADEWLRRLRDEFTGSCDVPEEALPYFALFSDPAEPTSIRVFTADTLPSGIRVKSARIERTTEEPTYGTTDILPWLNKSAPILASLHGEFFQDGEWRKNRFDIGTYSFRDGAS